MERDLFRNLPSEITTNILSRLPDLRSISISKCVCKPWLNLLESDDFVNSKIKTPPALALLMPKKKISSNPMSTRYAIIEFEDKDENEDEVDVLIPPLRNFDTPHGNSTQCAIFKIEDEADLESHDLHYIPLTDFDIPHSHRNISTLAGIAANGLCWNEGMYRFGKGFHGR